MICINRMLRGALKFSQKTPAGDAEGGGCGLVTVAAGLAGCRSDPAARISQTPTTKIRISSKYGK